MVIAGKLQEAMSMISAFSIRGGSSTRRNLRQLCKAGGGLILGAALFLASGRLSYGQTTAQLTGTVQDATGAVIPGAQVTLTDDATGFARVVQSNGQGFFAFPALVPDSYTVKVTAANFQPKELKGLVVHAGDERTIPPISLAPGSTSTTVTVEAASEMIPTDNGARISVLDSKQIENLVLIGRDTTELLKVLPGATTVSSGLTQNAPEYSDNNITVNQSAVGSGININGAVNRGGTALLADGANVIDPGNMASALSIINPEMTQEVSVQASNFGADTPFGPVVVSTISKSGGERYHGSAYFMARNSVLNANDWVSNHQTPKTSQGAQHYYYPGGNFGGPVPGMKDKLFFWGGYERWLQNLGNSNVLHSFIPTPEMMQGDFTLDNADNQALCPNGFLKVTSTSKTYDQGSWCRDLSDTILPDGTTPTLVDPAHGGYKIPSNFIDPNAAALAKIWPKANLNPGANPAGYNYWQPIPNVNDGWIYRVRVDYQLGPNTKIYGSYQQAYNSELAIGNGAHLYRTPGTAIPYPGGGETEAFS